MTSVLQPWVQELPIMQQSVLLSSVRNADMVEKGHPSKDLIRWYRRCILVSAFEGEAFKSPYTRGGGSFTGPLIKDLAFCVDDFLRARDGMSLHYYAHAMHAFEILGYKHPVEHTRREWHEVYSRMAHALHLWPETEEQMDARLGDKPEGWMAREDPSGGCST